MIVPFLLAELVLNAFVVFKSRFKALHNDLFWLWIFWSLIFGIYFFSGISWKYPLSFPTILFVIICIFSFLVFRYIGKRKNKNSYIITKARVSNKKILVFICIGVVGIALFGFDYIRLNGFHVAKSSYNISFIGSIGAVLIPILLVTGLYLFSQSLIEKGKVSLLSLGLLALYAVPCVMNSGRESILLILIAVVVIWSINKNIALNNKTLFSRKKTKTFKKRITAIFLMILVVFGGFLLIKISSQRFGDNEVQVFLYTYDVPASIEKEAAKMGDFSFLYYNVISYFGHQVPFLEFVTRFYDGPHMLGMYQFNIISRRLPSVLNLDYRLVYDQLQKMYSYYGESFKGGWCTIIGSAIIDFGIYFSPLFFAVVGFFVGKARKIFLLNHNSDSFVLIALICMCSFSTIQLSPFYSFLVFGSFVWWFIIFKTKLFKTNSN